MDPDGPYRNIHAQRLVAVSRLLFGHLLAAALVTAGQARRWRVTLLGHRNRLLLMMIVPAGCCASDEDRSQDEDCPSNDPNPRQSAA
jgi:hypothetical protein